MSQNEPVAGSSCCGDSCGCGPQMASVSRRGFLAATTVAAGAVLSRSSIASAIAGPFAYPSGDGFPIPADKKFTPAWMASLTATGSPTVYRFKRGEVDELKYIGMPVSGVCTGQLYLGGDGRLWLFDLFNLPAGPGWSDSSGNFYSKPPEQSSPVEHGFAARITEAGGAPQVRSLDRTGFAEIAFTGQYPIGTVGYKEHGCPVEATLEAFSPFIPLDEDDSGIPATVLAYTFKNVSSNPVTVEVAGWMQNPVCLNSVKEKSPVGFRQNSVTRGASMSVLGFSCGTLPAKKADPAARANILFEDFEKPTYAQSMGRWVATGTAFGDGPVEVAKRPSYMGEINGQGDRAVNTHVTSHGEDVGKADTHIGTLTSREFVIDRHYISFYIGGGKHPGQECLNLLVDGAPVRTATGANSNKMKLEHFDVREYEGKKARLQIVDAVKGGWGQIGIDDIWFCDEPREEPFVLEDQPDYGTMAVAGLGDPTGWRVAPALGEKPTMPVDVFDRLFGTASGEVKTDAKTMGAIGKTMTIAPGASASAVFVMSWYFPVPLRDSLGFLKDIKTLKRWYGKRFTSATDVAQYVSTNFDRLSAMTRTWRDTWYDSTLPYWFMDRTFSTVDTAATSTCYRFDNGRFYGWEGTYCCAGTCTHVWQYAQGLARIFPNLERSTREMIDFGQEFEDDTGLIHYRGEAARELAIDGQCGTILRAYREHTTSSDDGFLRKSWPRIKKAIQFVMARDENQDGILDGAQYNTLDTTWWGQISWISSLYLAVLRAGAAMAAEMNDQAFARKCADVADQGFKNMPEKLFNGEYFIHATDPKHPEANSTGTGCHIDQVFGQSFAHQLNLPRILPLDKTQAALKSLYKYSFAPDIGPYRSYSEKIVKGGRWYAMPGEGGLLMCTWPKGGSESATGKSGDAWAAGYFNECMSGFEHQVASHMMYENLTTEALAITRMIEDRYHALKRNPYNEVECSNHYSRAMAAYGTFLGACGFEYHGPKGHIGFSPKLTPEKFRAPFTAAAGWGTFDQRITADGMNAGVQVKHGSMRVRRVSLQAPPMVNRVAVEVKVGNHTLEQQAALSASKRLDITLGSDAMVSEGETLAVSVRFK